MSAPGIGYAPRLTAELWADLNAALATLDVCLRERPDADLSAASDYHECLAAALTTLGRTLRVAGLTDLPDEWETRPGPGSYARYLLQLSRDPAAARVAVLLGQDARNPAFLDRMRLYIADWAARVLEAAHPLEHSLTTQPIEPGLHSTAYEILCVMAAAYPIALTQDEIGERAKPIALSRSTVSRWLKQLRTRGLAAQLENGNGETITQKGLQVVKQR